VMDAHVSEPPDRPDLDQPVTERAPPHNYGTSRVAWSRNDSFIPLVLVLALPPTAKPIQLYPPTVLKGCLKVKRRIKYTSMPLGNCLRTGILQLRTGLVSARLAIAELPGTLTKHSDICKDIR
jgi:hypothetical protein